MDVIREDIMEKFNALNGSLMGNKKSLVKLQNSLMQNEILYAIITCECEDAPSGVLAITDNRLIYAFGSLGRQGLKSIPIDEINSITVDSGTIFSKLAIDYDGASVVFSHLATMYTDYFTNVIRWVQGTRKKLYSTDYNSNKSVAPAELESSNISTDYITNKLLNLKKLLDAGILTQDEYNAKISILKNKL